MTGQIVYLVHVSKPVGEFYEDIAKHIEECNRCHFSTEIQYQATLLPDGILQHSAVIIGRVKQ